MNFIDKLGTSLPNFLKKNSYNISDEQVSDVLYGHSLLTQSMTCPRVGPLKADINVIIFFDYQCEFSSKLLKNIYNLIQKNPNVKFLFKEWPIFSSRWPSSLFASKVALHAWQTEGWDKYITFQKNLFSLNKLEGKLEVADIMSLAKNIGLDISTTPSQKDLFDSIERQAQIAGIKGTPSIIITPSHNPNKHNTTIFPGIVTLSELEKAIDIAKNH
ncbi:thioredoxin domain-containing protein [Aeromonas bivalvium]|uniref:thioredoxin domain-containing protein n=1 Tax=Aeromonas bivalvium TaxID=440079 RepID=UPI0038CFE0E5